MHFPGGRLLNNRMMYTAVSRPTTKLVIYSPSQNITSANVSSSSNDDIVKLRNFYRSLVIVEREKVGTLEELLEEYNQDPTGETVEQFIERKKCIL